MDEIFNSVFATAAAEFSFKYPNIILKCVENKNFIKEHFDQIYNLIMSLDCIISSPIRVEWLRWYLNTAEQEVVIDLLHQRLEHVSSANYQPSS